MSGKTGIEWTDATWNPIRGAIEFVESALLQPLRWKRRRRIFVNSMSDLFHPGVTDEMLDRIFAVMALCPQHTFQVLTKRPERMLEYLSGTVDGGLDVRARIHRQAFEIVAYALQKSVGPWQSPQSLGGWPLANVWLGVSVENQKAADERIPLLLQTPAVVRFLSCEPLLGPLNLAALKNTVHRFDPLPEGFEDAVHFELDALNGCRSCALANCYSFCEESGAIEKLDWVIAGGESGKGPGIRPSHPDWFRSLRDQCATAGVPFFFKQHGEHLHFSQRESGELSDSCCYDITLASSASVSGASSKGDGWWRVGKKAAGDLLDGVRHHAFPEVHP